MTSPAQRRRRLSGNRPSLVQSLLKRFDVSGNALKNSKEVVVSTAPKPQQQQQQCQQKALFSPKYLDTAQHVDDDASMLNSPPTSPLKKKQQLDAECADSVQSIRQSLWGSVQEDMDAFLFMKYAPPLQDNYFEHKKPVLPKQSEEMRGRHTLVLDLDETLVHCSVDKVDECDLIFPVVFNGEHYKVYMSKRPGFKQFLEAVAPLFEVVVFTASQQCYADKLLNLVDPEHCLIHHRLFRHHCVNVQGNFVKDLRVLGRDLSKTVIIDNSPPAFTYQVENGIPIVSWYSDKHDTELRKMLPLLMKLRTLPNVQPALKKYFQLNKLLKSITM